MCVCVSVCVGGNVWGLTHTPVNPAPLDDVKKCRTYRVGKHLKSVNAHMLTVWFGIFYLCVVTGVAPESFTAPHVCFGVGSLRDRPTHRQIEAWAEAAICVSVWRLNTWMEKWLCLCFLPEKTCMETFTWAAGATHMSHNAGCRALTFILYSHLWTGSKLWFVSSEECCPMPATFVSDTHKHTFVRIPTSSKHQAHCGPRLRQSVQEVMPGDRHTLSPAQGREDERWRRQREKNDCREEEKRSARGGGKNLRLAYERMCVSTLISHAAEPLWTLDTSDDRRTT